MKRMAAALTAAFLSGTAAADESLLDSLARSTGLVAPEPDMPDFVKASRPHGAQTPLPAFAPPPEPRSKVKSPAELKAMDADLQRAAQGTRPAAPLKKPRRHKS